MVKRKGSTHGAARIETYGEKINYQSRFGFEQLAGILILTSTSKLAASHLASNLSRRGSILEYDGDGDR